MRAHVAKNLFDFADALECLQAIAPSAQLARGLRTAEEKQRQNRLLAPVEMPDRVEVVIEAHGAPYGVVVAILSVAGVLALAVIERWEAGR